MCVYFVHKNGNKYICKIKKICVKTYLVVLVLSLNANDGHDYDVDSGSDMLDCCCFSKYPRSVLTLAMHGHALNPVSIYSHAFDMINAVDTGDAVAVSDRNPSLFHDTYWQ